MPEPIRRSVIVQARLDDAFRVFTEDGEFRPSFKLQRLASRRSRGNITATHQKARSGQPVSA